MTVNKSFSNSAVKSQGFTLVEMALLVLVMGLFIGATVAFISVENDAEKKAITVERQKRIAQAMSGHAERFGVLPCPGAPDAGTLGLARASCASDALRDGIVPYRTLGLSQLDATDGFGNPFTYAVSQAAVTTSDLVDAKCRGANWLDNAGAVCPVSPDPGTPKYPPGICDAPYRPLKARFCCQEVPDANALEVVDGTGSPVTATQGISGAGGHYDFTYVRAAHGSALGQAYMAYVLVSHGKNGLASYTFGNASRKGLPLGVILGANEIENRDADRTYVASMPTTDFDDIVLWRTQERVISDTSGNDCNIP